MDRDEIMAAIAARVAGVAPSGETEATCRRSLSSAILHGGALLTSDEARGLARVALVPGVPTMPEPVDGFVIMTDIERDSLPADSLVDIDGTPYVLCDGVPCRLTVVTDRYPAACADAIVEEQDELARELVGDDPEELAALYSPEVRCPYCGGYSLTQVWAEDDTITLHCHDCDGDFSIEAPEPATAGREELIPELEIACEYRQEPLTGFLTVDILDGDVLLYEGRFVSQDEVEAFLDGFVRAFDAIAPGTALSSTAAPGMALMESVDGDMVTSRGMVASRAAMAVSVASGRMAMVTEPIDVPSRLGA